MDSEVLTEVVIKGITFSRCGQITFQHIANLDISDVSFSNCLDRISVYNVYQNVQMTTVSLSHCQSLFVTNTVDFIFKNSTVLASNHSEGAAAILDITHVGNVTIAGSLFSSNTPNSRSLEIDLSPSVIIDNCTFYNHSEFYGAALSSIESVVTLSETTFIGNSATCQGGAVYMYLGLLTVHNSTFLNNTVGSSFGYYCSGGAVYVENSSLAIRDSTFEHNSADRNDCGAVCNFHGDYLIVTDSRFRFNRGGDRGGALCSTNSTTIEKSFSSNRARYKEGVLYT